MVTDCTNAVLLILPGTNVTSKRVFDRGPASDIPLLSKISIWHDLLNYDFFFCFQSSNMYNWRYLS